MQAPVAPGWASLVVFVDGAVVVAVETSEPVSPGEQLSVAGERAGELTSVTGAEHGVLGLARVFWELRSGPFATEAGVELRLRAAP